MLYGGAAGGGKSSVLLMAALQYVDQPHYHALLLRRTFQDLSLPGALMPRSKEWLLPTDAHWSNDTKTWTFPSGSTLSFGYLQHEDDKYRYQSSEFQFIGFDELTQFSQTQYTYLFSRLRRGINSNIPIRMRSASNPAPNWVKSYFIDSDKPDRLFLQSKYGDNPHIDNEEYGIALDKLDMVERARLRDGDWNVSESGGIFRRKWFRIVDDLPAAKYFTGWVRAWDLAGTEPSSGNPDPDYTVGLKMGRHVDGTLYISDVKRIRANSGAVQKLIQQTAQDDGQDCIIHIEQEPGSSGKAVIDHYRRHVLSGYSVYGERATGSKLDRARPVSARAEGGDIKVLNRAWTNDFLEEINMFTGDNKQHDDQVDALSLAHKALVSSSGTITVRRYA